jgi:endonuclease YncB( thermonuclease family)
MWALAGAPVPAPAAVAPVLSGPAGSGAPLRLAPGVEFMAKVRAVNNAGTLQVVEATGAERPSQHTIALSSIILPKYGVPNVKDEPWGYEAREFLRGKVIGKKVLPLPTRGLSCAIPAS